MKIEIVCSVSSHGRYFAALLRSTGEILKSHKHEIEWRCIVDTGTKIPDGFICLKKQNPTKSAARNHALALNYGAERFESDCLAFIDSDIAFLYKGWDDVMVECLKTHDSFGVSHKHDFYRYHNYPVCQFMAFSKRAMNDISWNFMPVKCSNGSLARYKASLKDAKICGVPIGTILKKDTSWKVPYLLHDKGYVNSLTLDLVSVVSDKTLMPYANRKQKKFCFKICSEKLVSGTTRMAEYHYNDDVYCTHFGRSRKISRANKEKKIWMERINAYLLNRYGIEL